MTGESIFRELEEALFALISTEAPPEVREGLRFLVKAFIANEVQAHTIEEIQLLYPTPENLLKQFSKFLQARGRPGG